MKVNLFIFVLSVLCLSCNSQSKNKEMKSKRDKNFSCDIKTGICSSTNNEIVEEINLKKQEKVKLIYYTDPICSACWAIEPELKKLKLAYGDYVDIHYKMGGLLPSWEGFADNSNGISKPSDVAYHWDEVGKHTEMSIDGDVWLEDPLPSSYPPSIAFKAMQKQGHKKAVQFLRYIREMLFLEKKNITKEELLLKGVKKCGGDVAQFLLDYKDEATKRSFYLEIQEGREMGVRGFPTFIFVGKNGSGFKISGMSGYQNYVTTLERAYGKKITPKKINLSEIDLLKKYKFLATKEISVVLSQNKTETILNLEKLTRKGLIQRETHKFGSFWRLVD